MPKVKVIPLVNLAGMEMFFQDVVGKLVRRHQRKIACEGQHQNRVESGGLEQAEFLRSRSQEFKCVIGSKDARRMGLKGDDDRPCLRGLRMANDFIDDRAVSAVNAIEIADADDRGTEVAGDIVEFVEGQHSAIST